jgi:phage tail sheath protein FI
MPVFVTSFSQQRHAAYAIELAPPSMLVPSSTGIAGMVGQFAWGPVGSVFTPGTRKDLYNTFAPAGMSRSTTGFQALQRKAFPTIKVVRAEHSTSVAATVALQTAGSVTVVNVTAKYPGLAGNSLTATVALASDGNVNHFNLTVTVTGASGTTSDFFQNLNYSGTGANSTPSFANTLLVGNIAFAASGVPAVGTTSFATGSDVAVVLIDYIGTQGLTDQGLALFESDTTVRHIFDDDPGNTIRATVNAGILAHVQFMGDRVAYINGPSGQTAAAAQTDVATYRSTRVVYCDPWVYINDEVTGNKTLVPSASFAASVGSQLPTSTSIAWKNSEVTSGMLNGIVDVEFNRGNNAGANTAAGIATFQREALGGFSIEAGVVTQAAVDPTRARLSRTRIGDLVATTFVAQTRPMIDAPNVPFNQNAIILAVENLLSSLKNAQNFDPNHHDHILDYKIGDIKSANTAQDYANGLFIVPVQIQTPSGIEELFLSIQFGENVTITH